MADAVLPRRRRTRAGDSQPAWKDFATALLPVVACFLGGATEKWAEGIVVALLGLLLLANPPQLSLGKVWNALALAFVGLGAVAFLPAHWFFIADWREALLNDFGVQLPPTLSPQPWISAGCLTSLIAGLAWLYYVSTQQLDHRALRRQLRIFGVAVIALATLSTILYFAKTALPFWHNQRHFGPFPNRNQTADLLGITSVVIVACAQDEIRRRNVRWIFWAIGLVLVVTAILLNFSRAGLLILVAGSAAWLGVLALRAGTTSRIAIAASALLVLLTAVLLFGGETLARFHLRGVDSNGTVPSDFRWLIFHDALAMIRASPWCGIGLGNFQSVFALFREASLGQNRALHPESDWFWVAAELGWPSVLLIIGGATILARRVFPLDQGTEMRLRTAAFIGALLFALHGAFDVSAHRVGSAYAGLLLFGLALRRPLNASASRPIAIVSRIIGFAFVVIGSIWIYASARAIPLPGGIGADLERTLAADANKHRDFNATIEHAARGLQWAPLDWQLYFVRAIGEVAVAQPANAVDDFRRARFLEPGSYEVPYQEGLTWIAREPVLAITAWREALRRAGSERASLFSRMLSAASQLNPTVNAMLEDFAATKPEFALTYLERASGEAFNRAVIRLLENDPGLRALTNDQKTRLFALWSERGDVQRLADFVRGDSELLKFAWRGVAKADAAGGDFHTAFQLAQQFGERPKLPPIQPNESTAELQQRVFAAANDYEAGLTLYAQQLKDGKIDDALVTLRHFSEQPNAPAYFRFLEAEGWAAKGDWERAWNAFTAFDAAQPSR
ncbi:MAG TPA: O-antigen ligase family protein [Chthoniobacterales bacterium]